MLNINTITEEEIDALSKNQRLLFVKLLKERTGHSLKECKEFCDDNMVRILNSRSPQNTPFNIYEQNSGSVPVLSIEEYNLLQQGAGLACVKSIKERLQIGLKEAKDVYDYYKDFSVKYGMEYIKSNFEIQDDSEIYNNIPKGLVVLKTFTHENKKNVVVKIGNQEVFDKENQYDFILRNELSNNITIYTNIFDDFWEISTDINVYKKALNEYAR